MTLLQWILSEDRIRAISARNSRSGCARPRLLSPTYVVDACRDEALDVAAQFELLDYIAAADEQLDALLERHPTETSC